MSFIYISQDIVIHPHRHLIERAGEMIPVRPKTFALLLLLLERPHEILNKSYLLDTVWDDVTVDEPVLVQSIREIRQLFGNQDVIQTYPRKGYSWVVDVKKQELSEYNSQKQTAEQETIAGSLNVSQLNASSPAPVSANDIKPPFFSTLFKWRRAYLASMAFILIFGVTLAAIVIHRNADPLIAAPLIAKNSGSQTDVVIILPVKSQMQGNDHDWVYLGAMDQLINSLPSTKNVQVMDTKYVLSLMQYAHLPRDYPTDEVNRIFGVSGATLIVESQLSGSVEEYRLDYKLHFKNDIKRGAILEKNLADALRKLSAVVADYTDQSPSSSVKSQNAFTNELMARALDKFDAGDYELTRSFLTSLKQLEPDNMLARELLVQALVRDNRPDEAKEEINSAIRMSETLHKSLPASFYTALAIANIRQGTLDDALNALVEADKLARQNNDVLYQGYSAQLRGFILQQRNEFTLAQTSFEDTLKFYSIIRCPVGLALTHMDLAKLFLAQGKNDLARAHFLDAKHIAESHKLDKFMAQINEFKLPPTE